MYVFFYTVGKRIYFERVCAWKLLQNEHILFIVYKTLKASGFFRCYCTQTAYTLENDYYMKELREKNAIFSKFKKRKKHVQHASKNSWKRVEKNAQPEKKVLQEIKTERSKSREKVGIMYFEKIFEFWADAAGKKWLPAWRKFIMLFTARNILWNFIHRFCIQGKIVSTKSEHKMWPFRFFSSSHSCYTYSIKTMLHSLCRLYDQQSTLKAKAKDVAALPYVYTPQLWLVCR